MSQNSRITVGILGGQGNLGSLIVKRLNENNIENYIISKSESTKNIREHTSHIINCAGVGINTDKQVNREEYFKFNTEIPLHFARIAAKHGAYFVNVASLLQETSLSNLYLESKRKLSAELAQIENLNFREFYLPLLYNMPKKEHPLIRDLSIAIKESKLEIIRNPQVIRQFCDGKFASFKILEEIREAQVSPVSKIFIGDNKGISLEDIYTLTLKIMDGIGMPLFECEINGIDYYLKKYDKQETVKRVYFSSNNLPYYLAYGLISM